MSPETFPLTSISLYTQRQCLEGGLRPWTTISMGFLNPGTTPAKTAHIAFVNMANAFEQINQEMLTEMQEDIKRCLQPSDELHPEAWSSSRFSDTQVHKEKGVEDIKQSVSHTQSEVETFEYLTNTACLRAWSWTYQVLLKHQGQSHFITWLIGVKPNLGQIE